MKRYLLVLGLATALASPAFTAEHSYPRYSKLQQLPVGCCFKIGENPDGFLNMRTGPGVNFPIMTRIPSGIGGIKVLRYEPPRDRASMNPWCLAQWEGFKGWLSSAFITKE